MPGCGCRLAIPLRPPRRHSERKFDLLAQLGQNCHQPIQGEPAELGVADAGEIGMTDSGRLLRLPGGPLSLIEYLGDLDCQQALRLAKIGIGITEVAENIPAAAHKFEIIVAHRSSSLSLTRRLRISSISACGVLIPVFDFFWKA